MSDAGEAAPRSFEELRRELEEVVDEVSQASGLTEHPAGDLGPVGHLGMGQRDLHVCADRRDRAAQLV